MMRCVWQVELLGQELSDYVHPCDHHQLASLVPDTALDTDQDVEVQYTRSGTFDLNSFTSPF